MPLSNLTPFAHMAKIRMAQGIHRDELEEAAADVEALALLAYSSDHRGFVRAMDVAMTRSGCGIAAPRAA
jgi:hypothetical protein